MKRRRGALEWDDLRVFLALLRRGTLVEAARELGLDPTNVGRRLTAIEKRVGDRLFERAATGLVATDLARSLRADAEAMEASWLAVDRKLAAADRPAHGKVRIACSEAFATYWLLPRFSAIRTRVGDVELELVTSPLVSSLGKREADLALRFVRPEQEDLFVRRLGTLRWCLYGAPSYLRGRPKPDPESGLLGHRLVRWGGPPLRRKVLEWVDAHSKSAEVVLTTSHLPLLIEACVHGVGLAVVPGSMARARGDIRRVLDSAIDESELYLVVHRDLRAVARVRAVSDALFHLAAESRDELRAI